MEKHFCKICDKELKSAKGLGIHLKMHNITIEDYYRDFFMKTGEDKCVVCGKPTKFLNITHGYFEHCSPSCAVKDEATQSKIKKTCKRKYGVEHAKQSDIFKEKDKQTRLKHYGNRDYVNVEKMKQTKLDKYGDAGYNNRKKAKQTTLDKYGVENISQLEETKEKVKQTNLKNIGVENPYQQKHIKEKARKNSRTKKARQKRSNTYRQNIVKNSEKAHIRRITNENAKYQYNGISFDSKPEYDVYMYCINNNIPIEREPIQILFNNDTCATYPDFSIDNILVEIKGDQFINDDGTWKNPYKPNDTYQEQRRQAMLSNDVIIWTLEDVNKFINGDMSVLYKGKKGK